MPTRIRTRYDCSRTAQLCEHCDRMIELGEEMGRTVWGAPVCTVCARRYVGHCAKCGVPRAYSDMILRGQSYQGRSVCRVCASR